MKKLYLLLIAASFSTFIKAQYVNVGDTSFVKWLQADPDLSSCMGQSINLYDELDTTCPAVLNKKTLSLNIGVSNFTAVQYFKNLDTLIIHGVPWGGINQNAVLLPNAWPKHIRYFLCAGSWIWNNLPLPDSLVYLDCHQNYISSSIVFPSTLKYLNCSNNSMVLDVTFPPSLTYLDCSNNGLTAFGNYGTFQCPPLLQYLDCSNNHYCSNGCSSILSIDSFPATLRWIICNNDSLTTLPPLPPNLISLNCSNNRITSLPALPSTLKSLYCYSNLLTSLPSLPAVLDTLDTYTCNLTSLPAFDDSLREINCSKNSLTGLPALPAGLINLNCGYNRINALPALNDSLQQLACSYNQLAVIPTLNVHLQGLSCRYNQLTAIPAIPVSLAGLDCGGNNLGTLPALPASLLNLTCTAGHLTILPSLPPVMNSLLVDSNPNLYCLPPIQQLNTYASYGAFSVTASGVTCLPNRVTHPHVSVIPYLDNLPLCTDLNPNGCTVAWNIQGNTDFDSDNNCSTTSGEPALGKIKMLLYDSIGTNLLQQSYTNGYDGGFSFNPGLGNFVVMADTVATPFINLCPDSGYHRSVLTPADSFDYNANFRLVCSNGYDLGVKCIYQSPGGWFFPGDYTTVGIYGGDLATYYNVHCNTVGLAGTMQATITGPATYVGSTGTLSPATTSAKSVTWNINDLSRLDFIHALNMNLKTDESAHAGDQVCITATINGDTGTDYSPDNNTLTFCFTVVSSFDPNGKEVYPNGDIDTASPWLTYTVHFQNTGTAPAQNIIVKDTLDSHLDASTFELLSYSYPVTARLTGNIVQFTFAAINLPDSSANRASSIGSVMYRIKPLQGLGAGTQISNTASIYFDFNTPVATNTAVNTVSNNVATRINNISPPGVVSLYPNPTSNSWQLAVGSELVGAKLEMFDALGRIVYQSEIRNLKSEIAATALPAGVYFIRLSTAGEVETVKVVKE